VVPETDHPVHCAVAEQMAAALATLVRASVSSLQVKAA
jgi:hypothetical protein